MVEDMAVVRFDTVTVPLVVVRLESGSVVFMLPSPCIEKTT